MSRDLVDSWLDAFRKKDISQLRLAEDFVHISPFGEIKGREAYLDLVSANAEAFFSKPIDTIDVIGHGDKYAVRYVVGEMSACDCIYIRDGLIAKIHSYYHFGEKPVM